MSEPIKSGDLCKVVDGYTGRLSPNLGLVVMVRQLVYECPQLGRIWRCEAEYAELIRHGSSGCPPGMGDFAQSWLKRIDGVTPGKTIETTEGLTA